MNETDTPRTQTPTIVTARVSGKWRTLDGPSKKREIAAKMKAI